MNKLTNNPASENFTDQEIINLFNAVYGNNTYGVSLSELVKWSKSMGTIEATSLAIGFHEETHVFTYGLENCERLYKQTEVNVLNMQSTNYMFEDSTIIVRAIPLYIPTTMGIKDLSDYKIINNYLSNSKRLSVSHGLNGMLAEYYAFVRELDFLVKYRSFCIKYGVPDTASDRIEKIAEACKEWERATNSYILFTKENFDGAGYEDLEKANAITVLKNINKELEAIDIAPPTVKKEGGDTAKNIKKTETELKAATINNADEDILKASPEKIKSGNIWEVILNFITTMFNELKAWTQKFFAIEKGPEGGSFFLTKS